MGAYRVAIGANTPPSFLPCLCNKPISWARKFEEVFRFVQGRGREGKQQGERWSTAFLALELHGLRDLYIVTENGGEGFARPEEGLEKVQRVCLYKYYESLEVLEQHKSTIQKALIKGPETRRKERRIES